MRLINLTPRFWVAASLVILTLVIGLIGPLVIHVNPHATIGGLYDKPNGSTVGMWLGTDNAGQSVIANLVNGVRTSLFIGLIAGAISTLIGLVFGLVAGFQGGLLDDILMGVTNIGLAIPSIVVVILLATALNGSTSLTLAVVIGITGWPWTARAVRAQATSIRNREHIDVARLSGARWASILIWDVLPYLLSYVMMAFVLQMSGAILAEATISMLGLGASGSVSLGIMLYWALAWGSVRTGAWWAFLPPTLMLTLIAFSFLLVQASLDEVFNPRLRRGRSKRRLAVAGTPAAVPAAGIVNDPVLEGERS